VRRFDNPAPANVVPRPGPGGELDRRDGAPQGAHPGRQSPRPPGAGRSRLDPAGAGSTVIPPGSARPCEPGSTGCPKSSATSPGKGSPAVRPLSSAERHRQEAAGRRGRHRPREWPPSCGRSAARWHPPNQPHGHPRRHSAAGGAAVGNSRR
jgi:hypothetical protein